MIPNAEKMMAELEALNELSGPVFKIKNDPRLTASSAASSGAAVSTNCRNC